MDRAARLRRNLWLLAGFRALQMSLFPVAIVTIYWRRDLGFDMTEILLLQAIFGLFVALFEFPGGYVADRIGYRASLRIAVVFSFFGWIAIGVADSFVTTALGEVLLAVSLALSSGTDSAMLYESLLELDREDDFGHWFGRSRALGAASEGSAALVAGLLFAFWAQLPFFVQSGVWLLNGVLVLLLVEPRRAPPESHGIARVRALVHFAAVASPRLRASLVVALLLGLSTFVPVWLIAVYAQDHGVPVEWIGPMWAVANYAVAFGHWGSVRAGSWLGLGPALGACALAIAFGMFGLAATNALFGFAFYYVICVARGINGPLLTHEQQRLIPSSDRASLLSINSLLFRASFFVLGPVIGWSVDRLGDHQTFAITGLAFALATGASILWFQASRNPPGSSAAGLAKSDS
ncbi:MAG: MFS transporter [Myxococcota bacterium]|nr:MFS transporter [Myxococcota bacterium]